MNEKVLFATHSSSVVITAMVWNNKKLFLIVYEIGFTQVISRVCAIEAEPSWLRQRNLNQKSMGLSPGTINWLDVREAKLLLKKTF
jgi:hypothetical protein